MISLILSARVIGPPRAAAAAALAADCDVLGGVLLLLVGMFVDGLVVIGDL